MQRTMVFGCGDADTLQLWSVPWSDVNKAYVHEEGMLEWCLAAKPESINSESPLKHKCFAMNWYRGCVSYLP